MTLALSSRTEKSQVIDLAKSICAFLLFPRLGALQKNSLINAVQRLEALSSAYQMNVSCKFSQDITAETEIIIKIKFGGEGATN